MTTKSNPDLIFVEQRSAEVRHFRPWSEEYRVTHPFTGKTIVFPEHAVPLQTIAAIAKAEQGSEVRASLTNTDTP